MLAFQRLLQQRKHGGKGWISKPSREARRGNLSKENQENKHTKDTGAAVMTKLDTTTVTQTHSLIKNSRSE